MSHMIFALQYFKIVFFFFLIYIFIYLLSSGFYWDRSTGKDLSSFWNSNTIPMVWHDLSPRVHGVLLHTCSTTTYHFPYGKRRRFGSSIQNVHLRPTPTYHHTASFGPQVMYIVFKKKLIWQKRPFHLSDIVSFYLVRYFSSSPSPTEPGKLQIPASKGDALEPKASEQNNQHGNSPAVLSPPGKMRRVMGPEG